MRGDGVDENQLSGGPDRFSPETDPAENQLHPSGGGQRGIIHRETGVILVIIVGGNGVGDTGSGKQ